MPDFLMIDTEQSKLYKSFDTNPIYDAYSTSQYEQDEEEVKEEKLDKIEQDDRYKYDSLKVLGVEEFCKILHQQYRGQFLPYPKIKDAYQEYCKKYEYPPCHHRMLGAQLGKIGEKTKRGSVLYYYIK
jgi:hypothetical protein